MNLKLFKRRSQHEIDKSVYVDHDFTGGYDFIPWLLYRQPGTGLIIGFMLAMLWKAYGDWILVSIVILLAVLAFIWLKKIFIRMKNGYRRW